MAPSAFYNRIIFNANSAGTGDFLVLSAVTGYRTPAVAGVTDEKVVSYTAETADRTEWETGQGTYDVATTTVRRTTVRENSSGTTALINFATPPIVRLDLHAQDLHHPDRFVDVRDFGVLGNGFTDDTDGLQAAIDHAFNIGAGCVMIPDGFYCAVRKSIWLAPPGTYDNVDPVTGGAFDAFQFSMSLVGGENLGNAVYDGVTIEAWNVDINGDLDFNNGFPDYPILIVGPGQGMRVTGITVRAGAGSLFTTTFYSTSIGIAISGGPGGASRTMIERCWAQNVYTGFKTGWNEDSLSDANTFVKCNAYGCHIGYQFGRTQNYINSLIDCNCFCPLGVVSVLGKAVQIYGGNYSYISSNHVDFDISGTTGLVSTTANPGTYPGKFTTTITFDPGDLGGFSENGFTDGGGSNPVYTAFAIETESFGIIPLQFVSYNAGTNAVTLQLGEDWVLAHFGIEPDFTGDTDLEAEIQACTILYAAERAITFSGPGIHANGVHIENPFAVTCIIDNSTGSNADKLASLENIYFNWQPSVDLAAGQRKIQAVWPFMNANSSGGIRMIGGNAFGSNSNAPPPLLLSTRNSTEMYFEKTNMQLPNMQVADFGDTVTNTYSTYSSRARGHGDWDVSPFLPQRDAGPPPATLWASLSRGRCHTLGFAPAPDSNPQITPAHYTTLSVGPPVAAALGDYPIIHGGTSYRVTDWNEGVDSTNTLFAVSDHEFFSYGQDLSINWSYKGQSHAVYMDDLKWMFGGLKFGLDNGGGVEWYVVTGVFPEAVSESGGKRPGYVTTVGAANEQEPPRLVGTKTTTYTGSVVYQESYDWTRYGATATVSSGGGREVLAVATTWYVATTGSDITGDGTVGAPWETINFALSEIADNYELGDEVHTLQLADGTYMGAAVEKEFVGGGFLQILGNSSNVAAVVLDGSLDSHYHAAFAWQTPQDTIIAIADMTLVSDVYIVRIINRCQFRMGYINFGGDLVLGAGAAGVFKINCIATAAGSQITDRTDNITVSGNCTGYIGCDANMQVTLGENGGTTTMSGTPAFSIGTFFASSEAEIDSYGTSFSGAATGKRYALESGALLVTWDNGTLTYIPGNAEGTITGGAVVTYRT